MRFKGFEVLAQRYRFEVQGPCRVQDEYSTPTAAATTATTAAQILYKKDLHIIEELQCINEADRIKVTKVLESEPVLGGVWVWVQGSHRIQNGSSGPRDLSLVGLTWGVRVKGLGFRT